MKCKFVFLVLIPLIYTGCENDQNTPEDYAAVQETWDQFITNWNQLDAEKTVIIYFDDAILIPPQLSKFEGKPAITEFYESLFAMNQSAEYTHTTESIQFSQEQAIEVGRFSVKWVSNEGDSSTYNARAMVHWERDQYGDWKIRKLLFNNPPVSENLNEF
ncbi:MAG: DUF4440 domain-containing protein [Balneolaceae bacterium]|nr:DUF4440 domain-containing protein [Balneolaceae bacterium]